MIHNTYDIDAEGKVAKLITYIRSQAHLASPEPWPLILVIPGGGYLENVQREAEPIATAFNAKGFHAAVLNYSTEPEKFPTALMQVAKAINFIKENAKEWNVDPEKIFVTGYSAGGHLAASIGVFWNRDFLLERTGLTEEQTKPAGLILAYPVITSGEYAHRGSIDRVTGYDRENKELLELVSLEKQVTKDTPPTFIWSTVEDAVVPVENTLFFVNALQQNKVEYELHIYPKGPHGLALVTEDTVTRDGNVNWNEIGRLAHWVDDAASFIKLYK